MSSKSQNAPVQVRSHLVCVKLLRLQPELKLATSAFTPSLGVQPAGLTSTYPG